MNKRWIVAAMLALGFSSGATYAQEREFPTKPIKLIVPFAPGGPSDIVARGLADQMSRKLQQPVVVENRSGAGGAIGAEGIAASAPDGYTIGIASVSTHVVNPSCNPSLKYDPIKNFTPIALVADMPTVLVGRPGLVKDFKGFREAARKSTGHSYGTPGNCSLGHVLLEHLNQELGGTLIHVPYRGSAPAATDLVAGMLDFMSDTYSVVGPFVDAGKMKAIAVAWPTRLPYLKDVPTFAELGYPGVNLTIWYGIVGPAGLPQNIIDKYEASISQSLADPDLKARFEKLGIVPARKSPRDFSAFLLSRFRSEAAFIRSRKMSGN